MRLPRRILILIFLFSCLFPLASRGENLTVEALKQYFPLARGAKWIYQGTVKWTTETAVHEDTLTRSMEVLDVVARDHVTAYLMRGHPSELAWYEEGKEVREYTILQVGPCLFYELDAEAFQRVKTEDFLMEFVNETQLFLDIPLVPGKLFGEAAQLTRSDRSYCWVVDTVQPVDLKNIKGISPSGTVSQYTLMFLTRPDESTIEFVPQIGITRYVYSHHGTISEVDVKLVEYIPGKTK